MDAETQARIAAEANAEPVKPAAQAPAEAQAAEPAVKPAEEANEPTTADQTEQTPTEKPVETPTAETLETDKSAEPATETKPELPSEEEVAKLLESAGTSNEALGQELVDNDGKISDETIAKLKEHFDPAAVDASVKDMESGFAAEKAKIDTDIKAKDDATTKMNDFIYKSLDHGGDIEQGKKNLATLSEWAAKNMDAAELAAVNAKLSSGNEIVVKEGLQTAVDLWKKGQEKPMMTGDSAAVNTEKLVPKVEPLSKDQYIKIMASKKYQEDPEYADQIDSRRRKTLAGEGFVTPEYSASRMPLR